MPAALIPGWPLAIFRIAFGVLYLDMALRKAPWKNYGWLEGFIRQEIQHPAFPSIAVFLRDVVLPNLGVFGMLTFVTEMALGLALPQLTFAASGAGRVLGVDAWLRRTLPETDDGAAARLVRLAT
jgi:hypothetical protein